MSPNMLICTKLLYVWREYRSTQRNFVYIYRSISKAFRKNQKKKAREIKVTKSHKNRFGEGLGPLFGKGLGGLRRLLGGVWVVWGVSWALLGASWLVFGRSKSSFFSTWAQDGLQEAFWIDFGWTLGGFWEDLGGFGEGFGRIQKPFGSHI